MEFCCKTEFIGKGDIKVFKKLCYVLLAVLCLAIGCFALYNKFNKINDFFDIKQMENNIYQGTIMNDYGIVTGDYVLKCERVDNYKEGEIYKIKLNNADKTNTEKINGVLVGYFWVCKDKIVKMDSTLQEEEIVCQENDIEDTLSDEEKGWHKSLEYNGAVCKYMLYNNQVETGFYESMIWGKTEGLISYKRGFGAGADSVELKLKEQ